MLEKIMRALLALGLCLIVQLALKTQDAQGQRLDLVIQSGHSELITALAYSPNGKILASAGRDRTVKLWDVETGLQIKEIAPSESVYFQPSSFSKYGWAETRTIDGTEVFVEYNLPNVLFFSDSSLSTYLFGKLRPTTQDAIRKQHTNHTLGLLKALADDLNEILKHESLYSAERFKGVKLSAETRTLLEKKSTDENLPRLNRLLLEDAFPKQLKQDQSDVRELIFSHDSKLLAGREGGGIKIWTIETGAEISILQNSARQMAFSPDDRALAVIEWPTYIIIYDSSSGVLIKKLNPAGPDHTQPNTISFSNDGKTLLSIEQYVKHSPRAKDSENESGFFLRYWDVARSAELPERSRRVKADTTAEGTEVQTQCVSPDSNSLVYEIATEVKDSFGNSKAKYRLNLLKLDTGRERAIVDGFRSLDGLGGLQWRIHENGCAFTPDGRFVAVGTGDALDLYSSETGEKKKSYPLDFKVNTLGFRSDGLQLAVAGGSEIILLDREGKSTKPLAHHLESVFSYFEPNGGRLVLTRYKDNYQAFDLTNGKEVKDVSAVRARIEDLVTTKRWKISTGEVVSSQEHDLKTGKEYLPEFFSKKYLSPDRRLMAFPEKDKVYLIDFRSEKFIRSLSGHLSNVDDVVFSPDGKILASGSWDHTIKLWEVATGREIRTLAGYSSVWEAITSISFSPNGELIAATGQNKVVRIWDVASGAEKAVLKHEDVLTVLFSPESEKLVTADKSGIIKIWNVSSGAEIFSLAGHAGKVLALGFNRRGDVLASGGADKTIKFWNIRSGKEIRTLRGHQNSVMYVGFSSLDELVSESEEPTIEVWNTGTKQKLQTFRGFADEDIAAILSLDARTLAVEEPSARIRFLDVLTARQLFEIKWTLKEEHREIDDDSASFGRERMMAFGKDQFAIAFLSTRKTITSSVLGSLVKERKETYTLKLWKLGDRGRQEPYTKEVEISGARDLFFSPDGKWLILRDTKVLLWNTIDHSTILEIPSKSMSERIAISHDNTVFASGDSDGGIRLWDIAKQKEICTLRGHSDRIIDLSFHPEKNILMSQSADGTIKFWDIPGERELGTLIPLDENDWVVVTSDGRFDASPNAMKLMHYVYGLEVITLEQIKDAYYEPGLLAKLIGSSKEPLRSIRPLRDVKLYPEIIKQEVRPRTTTLLVTLRNRGGGIGPVRVSVNGKTVTEDARDNKLKNSPSADTANVSFDLQGSSLVSGRDNQITVTVSNYDSETQAGYINSRGTTILFRPMGEQEVRVPKLYAIVGGISDYAGDELDLRYAAKDAEDFAMALRIGAEKFFGPDQVSITTLSTSGKDGTVWPNKKAFREAFAEVAGKARAEDVLVIYLAGHGVTAGLGTDTYYFLTQEAQSASRESLSNPDVRTGTAISSAELTDWLTKTEWVKGNKGLKPLKQVMILDTCAAGTIAKSVSLMTRRELSGDQIRAIERLKDRTGFHILMGSAADAVSYEATQYGQGLLTYVLLQAMRGAKLRDGEYADVSELFQYAADEVPRLARNIGGVQRPLVAAPIGTSFDIGRFTKDEQGQVPLAQSKPFVLRPRLIDPDQGFDELGLETLFTKRLKDLNYATPPGSNQQLPTNLYVFVDADEMPDALRPSGTYLVNGNVVTVTLNLIRNGKKVASFQIIGDKSDLQTLTDNLTRGVAKALNSLITQPVGLGTLNPGKDYPEALVAKRQCFSLVAKQLPLLSPCANMLPLANHSRVRFSESAAR